MLDYYFKRPLFWDYIISAVVAIFFFLLNLSLTETNLLYSLISDLATTSLTLAGFVITLLTVLISFKSSEKPTSKEIVQGESVFQSFFKTELYFQTVRHLKNAAVSLTCVAISGYLLKLFLSTNIQLVLSLFSIVGITILCLTFFRCLLILSKIIQLQRN